MSNLALVYSPKGGTGERVQKRSDLWQMKDILVPPPLSANPFSKLLMNWLDSRPILRLLGAKSMIARDVTGVFYVFSPLGHRAGAISFLNCIMLGRDCFRALFRKQFPTPLNWLKSGFSRKSRNGFEVGEKWVSTHF